jgi:hypothetical protein
MYRFTLSYRSRTALHAAASAIFSLQVHEAIEDLMNIANPRDAN